MGSKLIRYPLMAGGTLLVEIDDHAEVQQEVIKNQYTLESVFKSITPGIEALSEQLRRLTSTPDQINIEFGVKLTDSSEAVISKSATEGSIKITLVWKARL